MRNTVLFEAEEYGLYIDKLFNRYQMKTFFTLCILTLSTLSFSQTTGIDDFIWHYKQMPNVHSFKIGSFFTRIGSLFVEEQSARKVIRKAKKARILISEDSRDIIPNDIKYLKKDVARDGYAFLTNIRDGGDKVDVYIREDEKYIRNILAFIESSDDQFVLLSVDCRLTYDEISDLINDPDL